MRRPKKIHSSLVSIFNYDKLTGNSSIYSSKITVLLEGQIPSEGRALRGDLCQYFGNVFRERSMMSLTHSVDPSIRPMFTRCFLTMTNVIQTCINFH